MQRDIKRVQELHDARYEVFVHDPLLRLAECAELAELDIQGQTGVRTGKDVLCACKRTFLIFLGMVDSLNVRL